MNVIIDYNSGNLHSAKKSFQLISSELGQGEVLVSADPEVILKAERIILPGVGSFNDCKSSLLKQAGLIETLEERVLKDKIPFLGICVGQQLMASKGLENNTTTAGLVVGNPWGDDAPGTQMIFETYQNESNGRYEERVIGNYTKANQTLWFKSSQFTTEEITIEIEVRDYEAEEEYYQSNQDFGEMLFCLLPFVYIVGLIAAFAKGNNALGIGLLCAIPAAVIFFPLFFFLALMAFGF